MSGGYQRSTARTRASQAVRSANTGPAITSRMLWPVSTSQSSTELIGAADKALSEAKTTGRNKVCVLPGFAGPAG
jgi:hypothetical protein